MPLQRKLLRVKMETKRAKKKPLKLKKILRLKLKQLRMARKAKNPLLPGHLVKQNHLKWIM